MGGDVEMHDTPSVVSQNQGLRMLVRIVWMPLLVRKSRIAGLNFAS
jgi:hypothetical protein